MTTASVPIRLRRSRDTSTRSRFIVLAIMVGAAALRFIHLGAKNLWLDESMSVAIARLGWSDFRKVITNREANMSLYYLLLKLWMHVGGSEVAIRTLSTIAAIATVWLVYRIGSEWFSRDAGLLAAALLACNAFHVRYAQEARSYALVALLVTAAMWSFVRFVEQPTTSNRRWFIAASVLALYAHFFALLIVIAQLLSLLLRSRNETPWREVLRAYAVITACFLPLAWFIAFKNAGQIGWLPALTFGEIYGLFYNLAGRSRVLVILYGLLVLAAGLATRRLRRPERWRATVVFSWLVVPIAIVVLASLRKPVLYPRFLIICLPAVALVAAVGIWRLRRRWVIVPLLVAMLGLSVLSTFGLYRARFDPLDQDWRGLTEYIMANARPGDALIVFHPFATLDIEYYRARMRSTAEAPQLVFPLRADGVMLYSVKPIDSRLLASDSPLMADLFAQRPRVWLVAYRFSGRTREDAVLGMLESLLRTRYQAAVPRNFGNGVDVYLYSR